MHADEPLSSYQANLRRGELLREQGRFAEAEKFLQQAIGAEPDNAEGYFQLAFCYCNWGGRNRRALQAADRAIALDPGRPDFFALRAWILINLGQRTRALQAVGQALALDPENILALNAGARAYLGQSKWKEAEAAARRALEVNARNEVSANLLATALRQQGRLQESRAVSADLLALEPESARTQGNAGWSALHAGDHRRANEHFLEALRLDPNDDDARRGLLHAFNSRVWIYRVYFRFIAWLGRHGQETRLFFLCLLYAGYRLVVGELRHFGEEGMRWALVVVALYLIVLCFGRYFAGLFLLLDPFARHAVTRREKAGSILAGLAYAGFIAYLLAVAAWPQAAVLLAILACFLWGALSLRWRSP